MSHLSILPRSNWWLAAVAVLALTAGEWLRSPTPALVPAVLAVSAAVLLLVPWRTGSGLVLLAAWLAGGVALSVGATAHRRDLLARGVPAETTRQSVRVISETRRRLDRLEQQLGRIADRAAGLPLEPRESAFDQATGLWAGSDPPIAVTVFDAKGDPRVWAGVHLVASPMAGSSPAFHPAPFYSVLEVRRQRADGGVAVVSGLLWADSVLAEPPASLAGGIADDLGADIRLSPPDAVSEGTGWPAKAPVVVVSVPRPDPGDAVARLMDRAGPIIAALLVLLVVAAAAATGVLAARFAMLALLPWLLLRSPIDQAFGIESLFSPAAFFSPLLGSLSSSAGALAVTGLLLFVLAVAGWHRGIQRKAGSVVLATVLLIAAPYLVREFGRGITPPAAGVPAGLWLTWHFTLLIAAAAMLTAAAALLRGREPPVRRGAALLGAVLAVAAAGAGVAAYTGRPAWPTWYTALWLPAIILAAGPARRRAAILAIGTVAGAGATLMTWGASITGRTDVAVRDINSLGTNANPLVEPLLRSFLQDLRDHRPATASDLYRAWQFSALRRDGIPTRLTLWRGDQPAGDVVLDQLAVPDSAITALARAALPDGSPALTALRVAPGVHHVATVRLDSLQVISVAVGPRSQLIPPAPLGQLLVSGPERTALYRLSLSPGSGDPELARRPGWRREGWTLRASRSVSLDGVPFEANARISLGRPASLLVRGGLLLMLDIAVVWLLWLGAERISGVRLAWPDLERVLRSYQGRLAIALSVFFVTPAAVLAAVSIRQLTAEAAQSGDLVLQRVLRDAVPRNGPAAGPGLDPLPAQARRVDAELARYGLDGRLTEGSDPVLRDLAVFPPLLDASVYHAIHLDGDLSAASSNGQRLFRSGYASLPDNVPGGPGILATVSPARDQALPERQMDVGFLLVLVTLMGILAAIAAARVAAGALSRPVADLRDAALGFGLGHDVPPPARRPPEEIAPVFDAFTRMAADVRAGQAALEQARRRTEQVLATVSTGVAALDPDGRVLLANGQAEAIFGARLEAGIHLDTALPAQWSALADELARARREGGEGALEVEAGGRLYAVRLASLGPEPGGLVIAATDVTDATQAARVLAWAELANQVAHAIKNPLTPLRLGMQHLQRVREKHPEQLADTLGQTAGRILAEIDRLDSIARAFSRFAAPGEPAQPLEVVDVRQAVQEVAGLYRLAPDVAVRGEVADGSRVVARKDELVEVLLNLCDNARNAGARHVTMVLSGQELEVRDDGRGIPEDHLSRIFEPRFSTTSSGSGLGLAIVRRLVEGWGGGVTAESPAGGGAVFRVRFQPASR